MYFPYIMCNKKVSHLRTSMYYFLLISMDKLQTFRPLSQISGFFTPKKISDFTWNRPTSQVLCSFHNIVYCK